MLYVWEFLNAFLFLYSEQTSLLFVILLFYPLRSLTCNGKVWTCVCFIVKVGSCMCVRIIVKTTVFFQCGSERDGDRMGVIFRLIWRMIQMCFGVITIFTCYLSSSAYNTYTVPDTLSLVSSFLSDHFEVI